jgi:hypothetical protein
MVSKRAFISCLAAMSLFISILTPSLFAQQMVFDDWTAVQALTPSDEVVITLKTEKEVKGKFLDAGAGEVSIERKGKRESVAKDTISQIHLIKGKAKKGQWALIGAGVGAGAGFAIGQSKNGPNVDDGTTYVFVGTLIGTGIGAATGYIFGMSRRKRQLIYQGR